MESRSIDGRCFGVSKEPITTQEYKRVLSKCKNHKSTDKGGLSAELVKLGGEALETIFIKIFNKVLETGKLPQHMQIVQLIPIFKKGARDACDNSRPIAITDFNVPVSKARTKSGRLV